MMTTNYFDFKNLCCYLYHNFQQTVLNNSIGVSINIPESNSILSYFISWQVPTLCFNSNKQSLPASLPCHISSEGVPLGIESTWTHGYSPPTHYGYALCVCCVTFSRQITLSSLISSVRDFQ